ncbi:hypothetical protein Tco_0633794 [Tanacetum coccineum]
MWRGFSYHRGDKEVFVYLVAKGGDGVLDGIMLVDYCDCGRTRKTDDNVSSVQNDAYMMIINEMHQQTAQCVSVKAQNKVVDASLTAELATYKEQVEPYERWAKFELTEREQKIDEQLRIVITDRNIKEENLKKELHSVKMQLNSTINYNKSMVEEVMSLKKDFKQKENKYLEEFLDMKALKEKDVLKMKAEALKEQTTTNTNQSFDDNLKKPVKRELHQRVSLKGKGDLNKQRNVISLRSVLYAINSELTVSRFTEMHDVHTVSQARCLELEAYLSKLNDKIQKDDHNELVKLVSNLEESVETLREIVEEARVERPLDILDHGRLAYRCDSLHIRRGIRYSLKDKNEAETGKTEHGNGKSMKSLIQRRVHLK